jgi:uncharacterized protein (TIGR00375 family)
MRNYFVDLHIHIGINDSGQWVKMATSRNLTLTNILHEGRTRKGLDVLGIVDAGSPRVQEDIAKCISQGMLTLLSGGGYRHCDGATLLLGSEFETVEETGQAHCIAFFPDLAGVHEFSQAMSRHIKNINLSSQNCHAPMRHIIPIVDSLGGIFIPAHAFTPHKSIYGSCSSRLSMLLPDALLQKIAALELGLSADSHLADRLSELSTVSFLSNSDAHSLDKIGREYNMFHMDEPSFSEVVMALRRENGRSIVANYGLDPRLGKYHRTRCLVCDTIAQAEPPMDQCLQCNSSKIVRGVLDRITGIADYHVPVPPAHRPPYHYQIPLEFIPGLGKKAMDRLLTHFGTEMAVLHTATGDQLTQALNPVLAERILLARRGDAVLSVGGGGRYGRMEI